VTAVYPAPPEETTGLLVLIDGMLPVQAPVQPAGSPALVDDPVLRASGTGEPRVGTVIGLPAHGGRLRGDPAGGAQHPAGRQRRPGRARVEPAGGDPHRVGGAGPATLESLPVTQDLADASG
jgi:hypothetical protein